MRPVVLDVGANKMRETSSCILDKNRIFASSRIEVSRSTTRSRIGLSGRQLGSGSPEPNCM